MPTINAQPTKPIAQACVVPYRRRNERIEFCLITSLKKKRWIFPKGIVDPGETLEEAALKEAFEEAGLHGRIVGDPIGKYEDSKWGTNLEISVVLMEVAHCDEDWLESDVRLRRWVEADRALDLLSKKNLVRIAESAIKQLR